MFLLLFGGFSAALFDDDKEEEEDKEEGGVDSKLERREDITAGESDNPVEFEKERNDPIKLLNSDVSSRCVALSGKLRDAIRSLNPFSTEVTVLWDWLTPFLEFAKRLFIEFSRFFSSLELFVISSTRRSDFREDKTLSNNKGKASVVVEVGAVVVSAAVSSGLRSKISSTMVEAVFISKDSVIASVTGSDFV